MPHPREKREETLQIPIDGRTVAAHIKRRPRQKYIRLRISNGGEVVISTAKRTSLKEILKAVEEKQAWLSRHLEKARAGFEDADPLQRVYFFGTRYPLHFSAGTGKRYSVSFAEEQGLFVVTIPAEELHPDLRPPVEHALAVWLRRKAGERFRLAAEKISSEVGIGYEKIFIRNQRTRWGSSSARGNISLNWRTIMAPPEVQRYLIIHELAHQRHLNHSARFWALVERHCPDYRAHESWLKQHRSLISLFR